MKQIIFYLTVIFIATSCSNSQVIIIDEELSSAKSFNALDSTEIFSVARWHKGDAPPKYEEFRNSELVIVTTKIYEGQLQKERYLLLNQFIKKVEDDADVLVMFNGIAIPKHKVIQLKNLKPEDLKSLDTLNREVAEAIYGNDAKTENVLINTYTLETDLINQ